MSFAPQTSIGFVGLGVMGGPMAAHLVRAGFDVVGCDLDEMRRRECVNLGARATADAAELVRECSVVCTCLPSSESFVMLAEGVLLPHARPGQTFIDFGTVVPAETRRVAAEFKARGCELLDVPVSGGSSGAVKGRLRMFAGGERAAFERVLPLLEAIGGKDRITYGGPSGTGQVLKGVNQLKSALGAAALAESLALAIRSGVSPETVAAAFSAGSGAESSAIVEYARAVAANPDAHFSVKFRELPYYLAEARAAGFTLPLTAALHKFCDQGERVVEDDHRPAPSFWRELRLR